MSGQVRSAARYGLRIALCLAALLIGPPWRISSASAASPASAEIQLTSISPDSGWTGKELDGVTITGSGFTFGMSITLSQPGRPSIEVTSFMPFSSTKIVASFDLTEATAGLWNLTVSHDVSGSATLPAALTIMQTPILKRVGTWGGPVHSMQVVGNLGYLARGSAMVILDLTDPANMVELSVTDMGGGVVNDVAVQGDYAFVCPAWRGISIYNITDPTNPYLVVAGLHYDVGDNYTDIWLHGNAAYVLNRFYKGEHGSLYTLDISDPTGLDPSAPGNFQYVDETIFSAAAADNHLYVVSQVSGPEADRLLEVYDLSADPLTPQLTGVTSLSVSSKHCPTGITVEGGLAYLTLYYLDHEIRDFKGILMSVDVSNPEAPVPVGLAGELTMARGVAASNGFVFVADFEWMTEACYRVAKGLAVFDVFTSPGYPALVGQFLTHGAVHDVVVSGPIAYLLDDGEGVIAMDVSNPADPVRLGTYHSPAWVQNLQKEGDVLYFSDFWNGVTALDVSDPSNPTLAGFYQTGATGTRTGHIGTVKVQNGLAYLAAGYNGLEVVDFADPQNPALIGGYQAPNPDELSRMATGLAVKGHALIVHTYHYDNAGLSILVLDVSVPSDPTLAFGIGRQSGVQVWEMTDEFLAFGVEPTNLPGGAVVHDLLDLPNAVIEERQDHWFGPATTMAIEGNRLYLNDARNELVRIVEYTLSPERVVTVSLPLAVYAMGGLQATGVQDGIVYATSTAAGLTLLDAREASAGIDVLARCWDDAGHHHSSVYVDGPSVYLGGQKDQSELSLGVYPGLVIYQAATPGSAKIDGDADLRDLAVLQNCFTGPARPTQSPQCRANFDFDDDGDVDNEDVARFSAVLTGTL